MGRLGSIKTRIRLLISRLIGRRMKDNNKGLERQIESVQVISFDGFDTLIFRYVAILADVFALVGKNVLGPDEARDFAAARIQAERESRSGREETTLDEVYERLSEIYGKEKAGMLKEAEIATEIETCHANRRRLLFLTI